MYELGGQKDSRSEKSTSKETKWIPTFIWQKRTEREYYFPIIYIAVLSQDNVEFQRGWWISSNFHWHRFLQHTGKGLPFWKGRWALSFPTKLVQIPEPQIC